MTPELATLKKLAQVATPGPWLEREDYDYYQGGTYLGSDPYYYESGKMIKGLNNGRAEYFIDYVCRVEGGEADKEYLKAVNPTVVLKLIDVIEGLIEGLESTFEEAFWESPLGLRTKRLLAKSDEG